MSNVVPIAICIAFIFGVSPIIHKYIFNHVPRVTPQLLFIFGGITYFLFTFVYAISERQSIITNIQTIPLSMIVLFLVGASLSFYANYLYFNIISKNPSHIVSSLIFISPLFTLILSYFLLKEEITVTSVIGILLIVTGVMIVAVSSKKPSMIKNPFTNVRAD